jgi:putative DNA primase/helicase
VATLDQAVNQMMSADMPPLPSGHPIADGKFHRYGPKKKAWYRLFEYLARNGRRYIHGSFGIWRGADSGSLKIESDGAGMDPAELERLQRSQRELAAREAQKRAERARFAGNRAKQQWDAARAAGPEAGCPYLVKKGVDPEKGLRFLNDGTLYVPMVRYDVTEEQEQDPAYTGPRRLVGLQKIAPDGAKLFNKGMAKDGAACRLGKTPRDGNLIIIVEGLATGLTVRAACKQAHPVFVAFDAGNLAPAALILRKLYPRSPFLFCADDDAYLEGYLNRRLRSDHGIADALHMVSFGAKSYAAGEGTLVVDAQWHADDDGVQVLTGMTRLDKAGAAPGAGELRTFALVNPGRTKANAAARAATLSRVCWPVFKERTVSADPDALRLTDFNDLAGAEGLAAVERQIADAVAMATWGAGGTPLPKDEEGEGKKGGGGKGGAGGNGPDWERFWELVNRFTLIYPTATAYDAIYGDIVPIDGIRLRFGASWTNMWLASAKRKVVDLPDVVFKPDGHAEPHQLNLFRGFGTKPSADGSCVKLLELLQYICGEADQDQAPVTEWVLKWIAYPLQHPGAKMATAIVMAGKEGAGKNLFFGAIRDIYGQHGGVITQRELEDRFNVWMSAKLFMIANEVVTRQEMNHNVGFLKHLITEPEIWINRKNREQRCEENHMNMVFFSNEYQPVKITADDRRWLIARTPPMREEEFYKAVLAELAHGGAQALYAYLLQLPLGDFGTHTKPLITQAKLDLIEIGMDAPQLFWEEIHDGSLGLPYCPALVQDVYRAFCIWCVRNGEKMPARINRFAPSFMSLNGVQRRVMRVPDPDRQRELVPGARADEIRQRKVFLMGEPKADAAEEQMRIVQGVAAFRAALKEYSNEDVLRRGSWSSGERGDEERA